MTEMCLSTNSWYKFMIIVMSKTTTVRNKEIIMLSVKKNFTANIPTIIVLSDDSDYNEDKVINVQNTNNNVFDNLE